MKGKISVLILTALLLSNFIFAVSPETPNAISNKTLTSGVDTQQSQQTVTADSAFKTPDWVKNAIFYQIFPDRFRNGDPSNDPVGNGTSGDVLWKAWTGGTPIQSYPAVYALKMPWTSLPVEGPGASADWFGGDLKGVQDKAQYLADLGITAIYFNPTMDSTDNRGYTPIDYKSVSWYFGANKRAANGTLILDPEASLQVFRNMTTALDQYGIKIILDGVFNHVSAKNQWFDRDNDYSTLGVFESQNSTWYNWFTFYNWPTAYYHWDGDWNMPVVNEIPDFENYIYANATDSVIKFWNDLGVDGWRLDTGNEVNQTFWQGFRTAYKALNPDGYIVGELFSGDPSPYLQGDEWDSAMNYQFRDAVLTWASGTNVLSVTALDNALATIRQEYPPEAFYASFNLLGSHDTERALTYLMRNFTPLAVARNKMKLAVIFQMTYPGAPVIYYGDEVGLQGLGDPDCRRPYPWSDMGLSPDNDMLAHYKKLISIRKSYSVLRTGSLSTLLVDDTNRIYSLLRKDNSTNPIAVLVYNNGNTSKTVTLNVSGRIADGTTLTDVLNYNVYKVENGKITIPVKGLWADILISGNVALPNQFPWIYVYTIVPAVAIIAAVTAYVLWRRRKTVSPIAKSNAARQN
jgi:glycosidase